MTVSSRETDVSVEGGSDELVWRLSAYFRQRGASEPEPIPHPDQGINRLNQAAELGSQAFRRAAVLIPIVEGSPGSGSSIVLTVRTQHLSSHAGQVSLPGGTEEDSDRDAVQTALREAEEEIGLHPSAVHVMGQLGNMLLPSGFCVTPVVGLLAAGSRFQACPSEVAEIFQVPTQLALNPDSYRWASITYENQARRTLELHYEGYRIWGATAAILHHLGARLENPEVRIS